MSPVPSFRAKRDANEREIIDALESEGCAVQQLSAPGVPDLLVWVDKAASYELFEVKVGNARLTPTQEKWWTAWLAKGGRRPFIVNSPAVAVQIVRYLSNNPEHDTPASYREAK